MRILLHFSVLVAQETKIWTEISGSVIKVGLPNKSWWVFWALSGCLNFGKLPHICIH